MYSIRRLKVVLFALLDFFVIGSVNFFPLTTHTLIAFVFITYPGLFNKAEPRPMGSMAAVWEWQDGARWSQYDAQLAQLLETKFLTRNLSVPFVANGQSYKVLLQPGKDLHNQVQTIWRPKPLNPKPPCPYPMKIKSA